MTAEDDPLARAFGYPYAAPRHSYLFEDGRVEAFDPGLTLGRTPVLAIGSNRAPEQLARKYAAFPGTRIPVERAFLEDFDVVHAATLTRYGAVPAMLQHVPGTRVELMLTWLTDAQLHHMHSTELGAGNYSFVRLEAVRLRTEAGTVSDHALCYVGARGAFADKQADAYALAAVPAEHRRLPQADTKAMLTRYAALLGGAPDAGSFALAAITDDVQRRSWVDALAAHARPFSYPWRKSVLGPD